MAVCSILFSRCSETNFHSAKQNIFIFNGHHQYNFASISRKLKDYLIANANDIQILSWPFKPENKTKITFLKNFRRQYPIFFCWERFYSMQRRTDFIFFSITVDMKGWYSFSSPRVVLDLGVGAEGVCYDSEHK